jgi:hypothetical protein
LKKEVDRKDEVGHVSLARGVLLGSLRGGSLSILPAIALAIALAISSAVPQTTWPKLGRHGNSHLHAGGSLELLKRLLQVVDHRGA